MNVFSVVAGVTFAALINLFGVIGMEENNGTADLSVVVTEQTAGSITLRYQLSNRTAVPIYAFDTILRFSDIGNTYVDEFGAYVFRAEGGIVRLVRGMVAPPMTVSVNRRPPPVALPIQAGGNKTGTIKLALPLSEINPYFQSQVCKQEDTVPVNAFRLQVGWVEQRPEIAIERFVIGEFTLLRLRGGWGQPLQRTATADVAVNGIRVCPHVGPFDRPLLQK